MGTSKGSAAFQSLSVQRLTKQRTFLKLRPAKASWAFPGLIVPMGLTPERRSARSVENLDPELERLIMPFDIPDQIVAKFGFVTLTQNLSIEFL